MMSIDLDPKRVLKDLSATYWFIPSCMATLAVVMSFVMPWLDSRYSIDPAGFFGWVAQTQTDGARAVLIAIAGSIIGVTGTIFSITIVAVSFASANFGPRLIANFMRDRGNQLTLGTFIATFVYCLLVLRRVHNAADAGGSADFDAFVPHLSVVVALLLALASVGVLIYFIHHVPETINIDRLVAGIGRHLKRSVAGLFPGRDERARNDSPGKLPTWDERITGRRRLPGSAHDAGFLQRIDLDRLTDIADDHNALVRIQYRPGDFVVEHDSLFDVFLPPADGIVGDTKAADGEVLEPMRDCFTLGHQRTPEQDCLFLADQLGEVVARALSPGINDPFTATTCLDWLKGALLEFLQCEAQRPHPPSSTSVLARPISFETMLESVFDRTRQYVCSDRVVALHAMTLLAEVSARTTRADHRAALRRRMDALRDASASTLTSVVDRADVTRRHAQALQLLDAPDALARQRDGIDWFGGSG